MPEPANEGSATTELAAALHCRHAASSAYSRKRISSNWAWRAAYVAPSHLLKQKELGNSDDQEQR